MSMAFFMHLCDELSLHHRFFQMFSHVDLCQCSPSVMCSTLEQLVLGISWIKSLLVVRMMGKVWAHLQWQYHSRVIVWFLCMQGRKFHSVHFVTSNIIYEHSCKETKEIKFVSYATDVSTSILADVHINPCLFPPNKSVCSLDWEVWAHL